MRLNSIEGIYFKMRRINLSQFKVAKRKSILDDQISVKSIYSGSKYKGDKGP